MTAAASTLPDLIGQLKERMTPQAHKPRLTIEALAEIDRRLTALDGKGAAAVDPGTERTDVLTFTVKLGVSHQADDDTYQARVRVALRASLERLAVLDATIEDADVIQVCVQAQDDVTDALRASVKGR